MIKEAYEQLKKEHALPDYDALNHAFEISTIEKTDFLLREIKRKIAEKFEPVIEVLEHAINPDPNSFIDMYECRCITDADKKNLVDVFRHLMDNYRSLLETELLGDDKTDAETITAIHTSWAEQKHLIIPFIKKLRACWQKHVQAKEMLEYLG